jgi:hypothetical protein
MTNYELSNKIECVTYNKFNKTYYTNLLNAKSVRERLKYSNELLNYLCIKYKINTPQLVIIDRNQPNRSNGHKCGDYNVNRYVIRIWNKTAKLGKEVSIKQFINTLLHEFMHHYDYKVLKLDNSIHSKGFYMRISDLEKKLQNS